MSRILLVGGHGKVARLAEPLLVRDGHTVDALIRNPDHTDEVAATGATPVVADVETLTTDSLVDLSAGYDVVIWAAGAGGGNPDRTYAVDRDAAIRSIDAAERARVPRYVMVSYFGAGPDHGTPASEGFFHYAEAKAAADTHLRESGLEWVILGPSRLTDEPGTGAVTAPRSTPAKDSVSRADVAAVLAAVATRTEVAHVTWEFNNGDTPVEEALAALA